MSTILMMIVVLGTIIVSMVLHELAHGYMAYLLGDMTAKEDGRLTLNPVAHLDPMLSVVLPILSFFMGGVVFGGAKPVPVNFSRLKGGVWGMALVALVGPLMNFVLAFIAYALVMKVPVLQEGIAGLILVRFAAVNLGFGVFNLIPIPPLDGSRILYALMPDFMREAMDKMEKVGIVLVYILVVLGGGVFTVVMREAILGTTQLFDWILGL